MFVPLAHPAGDAQADFGEALVEIGGVETSDTYTLGFVFRPQLQSPLIRSFSLSVDYYNIKIQNAIGLVTGDVIVQRCFNGAGDSNPSYDPNNFYCGLIHRGAGGGFSTIDTPLLNLAGYRTSGIDVQLDWKARIGASTNIGLNAVVSYLDKYEIQTLQGAAFSDYAGTIGNGQISASAISHPRWRAVTNLAIDHGPATFGFTWRWIDKMSNASNVGISDGVAPGVKAVSYFDFNARVAVNEGMWLRFGVLNIGDKQPPEWTGESATDANLYDVVGRRFFVGASLRF
jgi:outer membrane receptor protein involved in Fe transport